MVSKRTLRCKQKILLKKLTPSQALQEIGLILAEIPQGERISNTSQMASEFFWSPAEVCHTSFHTQPEMQKKLLTESRKCRTKFPKEHQSEPSQ